MNDFVLPAYWYVKVNNDNRKVINDWKLKQHWNENLFDRLNYNYVDSSGAGHVEITSNYKEISFKEFEEYVLGIKKIKENDNYDYLIEVLNKYDIK